MTSNNCSSPCQPVDPCSTSLPFRNLWSNEQHRSPKTTQYRISANYRPLQQMYKTIYSPSSGSSSSPFITACICRPAERYKTANMTYGSFHYNNWKFMQKNQPVNCGQSRYGQRNDRNRPQKMPCTSEVQKPCAASNRGDDFRERQYWCQPTSDACCPVDVGQSSPRNPSNCCNY